VFLLPICFTIYWVNQYTTQATLRKDKQCLALVNEYNGFLGNRKCTGFASFDVSSQSIGWREGLQQGLPWEGCWPHCSTGTREICKVWFRLHALCSHFVTTQNASSLNSRSTVPHSEITENLSGLAYFLLTTSVQWTVQASLVPKKNKTCNKHTPIIMPSIQLLSVNKKKLHGLSPRAN
jgi:hypothetical protein